MTDNNVKSGSTVSDKMTGNTTDRALLNPSEAQQIQREIAGPAGPEPTRYGDWEKAGRCIDF